MAFKGDKLIALCCGSIIQSQYEGHLSACSCKSSFVDQTKYYARVAGRAVSLEYFLGTAYVVIFDEELGTLYTTNVRRGEKLEKHSFINTETEFFIMNLELISKSLKSGQIEILSEL